MLLSECRHIYGRFVSSSNQQTFDVTLEQLGQDSVRCQLVEHAAQKLFGYTCYIPWNQHAAKHHRANVLSRAGSRCSHVLLIWSMSTVNNLSALV